MQRREDVTECLWVSSAAVLQPQHGRDVPQHPAQGPRAQAQRVQLWPGASGRSAAEGPHQEAGLQGRLCESTTSLLKTPDLTLYVSDITSGTAHPRLIIGGSAGQGDSTESVVIQTS